MAEPVPMVDVELIIDRENHKDILYGTEVVWLRKHDIKSIPAGLWPKFAKHPDVYKLVEKPSKGVLEAAMTVKHPKLSSSQLETMDDEEVHRIALSRGYNLHHRLAGENLRARFLEAQEFSPSFHQA